MKTEQPILITSILAAAALTARKFVGFDGNHTGANAKALGVCNADTGSGSMAPVVASGIALIISGGIVAAGAHVVSDSSGRAVAASAAAVATTVTIGAGTTAVKADAESPTLTGASVVSGGYLPQAVNGYALDAASGAGEFIRIKLA